MEALQQQYDDAVDKLEEAEELMQTLHRTAAEHAAAVEGKQVGWEKSIAEKGPP